MILQPKITEGKISAAGFRFAILASRWNETIVSRLIAGAVDVLGEYGASEDMIGIFRVPGAFEIPLAAKKLAETGKWDAIICVGTVIRGDTPHFDLVANAASEGGTRVSLDTGIPVLMGVIAANDIQQAIDRAGKREHNKGFEAAMAAIEVVNLYKDLA